MADSTETLLLPGTTWCIIGMQYFCLVPSQPAAQDPPHNKVGALRILTPRGPSRNTTLAVKHTTCLRSSRSLSPHLNSAEKFHARVTRSLSLITRAAAVRRAKDSCHLLCVWITNLLGYFTGMPCIQQVICMPYSISASCSNLNLLLLKVLQVAFPSSQWPDPVCCPACTWSHTCQQYAPSNPGQTQWHPHGTR
jgi:hypothetical protein